MEASRAGFDKYLSAVRFLVTRAPQYILPFWYAKEPMLWLPHGWFPYYAEWIISFPRGPMGSVSIASWQLACTTVTVLVSDLLRGILQFVMSGNKAPNKTQEAPVKAGTEKTDGKEGVFEEREKLSRTRRTVKHRNPPNPTVPEFVLNLAKMRYAQHTQKFRPTIPELSMSAAIEYGATREFLHRSESGSGQVPDTLGNQDTSREHRRILQLRNSK